MAYRDIIDVNWNESEIRGDYNYGINVGKMVRL